VSFGNAVVAGFVAGFCWAMTQGPLMSKKVRNITFFISG
jgi:hypothetical protein